MSQDPPPASFMLHYYTLGKENRKFLLQESFHITHSILTPYELNSKASASTVPPKEGMKMDSSTTEVGSTEDIVKGLLEYLVAPLLPLNTSSARATPSASQQESVAKQMHATVLLYNYYQRKRHPELQFLDFESFSKLAVALKPSLMLHMKFTHHLDLAKLDDLENHLSPTETAIMNACSVSRTLLDASKDLSSSLEEWPIIKVAVLLVDSTKENCLLTFGSITNGVWSVIEKDLDPENVVVSSLVENEADDEAGFQHVAFSAVKEKAGIGMAELKILESNVTFTTSKEKTATRFYIMRCTQPNRKFLRVPIKDAIDSLQGPLVERSSGSWRVTPVVEYFHLLPYAPIVSRVFHLNSKEDSMGKETVDVNFYQSSIKPCEKENGKAEGVLPKTLGDVKVGLDSDVKVGLDSLEIDTPIMDKLFENHISDAIDSSDKSCLALDVGKEAVPVNLSEVTENPCDMEVIISKSSSDKEANVAVGFPKQKDCEGSHTIDLSNSKHFFGAVREEASQYIFDTCRSDGKKRKSFTDPPSFSSFKELTSALHSTDINENPAVGPAKESVNNSGNGIINVYQYQKRRTPSVPVEERCKNASTNGTKTKAPLPVSDLKIGVVKVNTESCISDGRDASVASEKMTSVVGANSDGIQKVDHSLVPFEPKGIYHEKFLVAIAEKETALSQAALGALNTKKEKLTNQLHNLKDEIALCERNIQAILDGAENNFSIKLEAIIDCCNDVCLQNKTQAQYRINQQADAQDLHQNQLGKRLSEAILIQRTSCQELDDICCANNWMLPKYSVFPSEGGFLAYVIMKGLEFECSSETDHYPSPHEARNAAAKQMIAKLRSMANQVH